jgi:endonuclease/exonuclease/phosphatase family metal-dependent hydrolase
MIAVTGIIVICYFLGLSAQWISPEKMGMPTYFVMLMPIWIVLMMVIIVFWLCFKKWIHALIVIGIMVVTFGQWRKVVTINNPFRSQQSTVNSQQSIKILTFNTHIFNNHKDGGFEEIAKFIEESDADIVCLQEFGYYHRYGASKKDILKFFDSIYPYRHLWFKNQTKWGENGLATFSRYPIIEKKKIEYESADNISIYSDIVIDGDTIRVINNHLESNRLNQEDRKFAEKLVKENNEDIIDAGKKVGNRVVSGAINRTHQSEAVRDVIESTPHYVIALGDFNDVALSYTYHTIGKDLQDAYSKGGHWGYHWTYNKNAMLFAIDHILVDEKINVIDSDVHRNIKISDHYPLSCEIVMP